MTFGEGLSETAFVAFLLGSPLLVASGLFSKQGNVWYAIVLHSGDMYCPLEVVLQWQGINAGDLVLHQNFNVCHEFTAVDAEDGSETALVKVLEETYVTAVGDLSLCAIRERGRKHCNEDRDLCIVLQAFYVKDILFAFKSLLSFSLSIFASD